MNKFDLEGLVHVSYLNSMGKAEKPKIEGDTLIIDWQQYGFAGAKYKEKTKDLNTCMDVVLYNPELKVGFMAHIPPSDRHHFNYEDLIEEFLEALKGSLGPYRPHDFNSAIVGASYFSDPKSSDEILRADKRKRTQTVKKMADTLQHAGFRVFKPSKYDLTACLDIERELILNNTNGTLYIVGRVEDNIVEKATLDMVYGDINYILNPKFRSQDKVVS